VSCSLCIFESLSLCPSFFWLFSHTISVTHTHRFEGRGWSWTRGRARTNVGGRKRWCSQSSRCHKHPLKQPFKLECCFETNSRRIARWLSSCERIVLWEWRTAAGERAAVTSHMLLVLAAPGIVHRNHPRGRQPCVKRPEPCATQSVPKSGPRLQNARPGARRRRSFHERAAASSHATESCSSWCPGTRHRRWQWASGWWVCRYGWVWSAPCHRWT